MQRIRSSLDQSFSISRLAMGLWRLADWDYRPQQTLKLLEQLLEIGITTVDLADIYGDYRCEQLFGEALKLRPGAARKDRDSIQVRYQTAGGLQPL